MVVMTTSNSSSTPFHEPIAGCPFPLDALNKITQAFVMQHDKDDDAHLSQALAFNAARLAWRMREAGISTQQKTSVSDVVTAADLVVEGFVEYVLRTLRPEDGLLGEEGAVAESSSGRTWVIDPVDGTYNFSTNSDYWCSALALVEGKPDDPSDTILAAVHRADMGYSWFAGQGHPAMLNGEVISVPQVSAAQTCLGGYLHPTDFARPERYAAWRSVAENFATVRMFGSASVDLSRVAQGQMGCWMQHSVASWDWLPGRILVEAAGGVTRRVQAGGVEWFIAGAPAAVAAAVDTL